MPPPSWTHLRVRSAFSFGLGADRPATLAEAAARRGFTALALTDVNGVCGVPEFLEACAAQGIKPLVGADVVDPGGRRATVLPRDHAAWSGLCGLLTRLHRAAGAHAPRPAVAAAERLAPPPLFDLGRELAALPGRAAILAEDEALLGELIRQRGASGLFAAVRPGDPCGRRAARLTGLPPAAVGGVHFAEPAGREVHRLLRTVALNTTLSRLAPSRLAPEDAWMVPAAQVAARLPDLPEALANAAAIALEGSFLPGPAQWGTIFPDYDSGPGETPATRLARLCYAGARQRYGEISEAVAERLEHELRLIEAKRFAAYFLVVHDIVGAAPRTCGRGSAAASLVSYCLGITQVEPIGADLMFERFLSPGRVDPPDIDVDFPWDERDGVVDRTVARWGRDRCAFVATHQTFQARAAVRETARAWGLPDGEIGQLTRRLPHFAGDAEEALRHDPRCRGAALPPPWPEILRQARGLYGLPRGLGVHCGGIVIVPRAVADFVPCRVAAKGVDIIDWEKDGAEAMGLVKIDLLGNRSLAVIRDALAAVAARGGPALDMNDLDPQEDAATQRLLAGGRTMGVFYVESPASRLLQLKAGRGDFPHVVLHTSIIRPASNEWINEYVERVHGKRYAPIHPALDPLLAESYGILVYQEDVARAAIVLAGFDPAEADGLRKTLARKDPGRRLEACEARFREGAAGRGVAPETIDKVWRMIRSFSGYSFCKPHSASYAQVSFKSAYIKSRWPAEFMAAVLANGGGFYSPLGYISECRRMGLCVFGPDVNASLVSWSGRDGEVRCGLAQILALRETTPRALIAARERGGRFASVEDFFSRCDGLLQPAEGVLLARAGALDALAGGPGHRPLALAAALAWGRAAGNGGPALFRQAPRPAPPWAETARPGLRELARAEIETLGFPICAHPLDLLEPAPAAGSGLVPARDLEHFTGRVVALAAWPVAGKVVPTAGGELMEFVSFEDRTALYETVVFPDVWRRIAPLLVEPRALRVIGRVENDHGATLVRVRHAEPLLTRPAESSTIPAPAEERMCR